jgi:hypothetical protein
MGKEMKFLIENNNDLITSYLGFHNLPTYLFSEKQDMYIWGTSRTVHS